VIVISAVTETNASTLRPDRTEDARILVWVDRLGEFFEVNYGMAPITGRIVGWLLVCDPAEQSAGEISAAIKASRASLTTNVRALIASGLVRRLRRAGARTAYYRIDDAAWEAMFRRRVASLAAVEPLTDEGARLLGAGSPRAARLRAMQEVFAWFEALIADAPGPPSSAGA
jgi:DNA-binding MarR family transcriptional regulator